MEKITITLLAFFFHNLNHSFAQSTTTAPTVYPKVVGYLSFILPIGTVNKNAVTNDFSSFRNGFAIGFPVGINVLYSSKFGFSYEITPTVQTGNRSSKTSKIVFDPGPMFRFKHGFTFIPRLAFETGGIKVNPCLN